MSVLAGHNFRAMVLRGLLYSSDAFAPIFSMVSPSAVNDDIHSLVGVFPFSIRLAVHSNTARGTSLNIGNKLVIRCGVVRVLIV